MAKYAAGTSVSPADSRLEIEKVLTRYGAQSFMYGWEHGRAALAFHAHGVQVRFLLPMPDPDSREFTHTPKRKQRRSNDAAQEAYEQAVRQRWRALVLVIKAKLEAVESGIVTFEDEFLAHIVLPSNTTVGQWVGPQLNEVYGSGQMPSLLPGVAGELEE